MQIQTEGLLFKEDSSTGNKCTYSVHLAFHRSNFCRVVSNEQVYYLGGVDTNGRTQKTVYKYVTVKQKKKVRSFWVKMKNIELAEPFGDATALVVGMEYCEPEKPPEANRSKLIPYTEWYLQQVIVINYSFMYIKIYRHFLYTG